MNNDLPWKLKKDLQHFSAYTQNKVIVMGRKTFESMPRALPNRTNVIITRKENYIAENAIVTNSLESALKIASDDAQPFIIGGGEIYRQGLAYADSIELTRVHADFEADTFFPDIDPAKWREVWRENRDSDEKHQHAFSFIRYEKIKT